MKRAWSGIVAFLTIVMMSVAANAQALSQVPNTALVVVHIKNMQDLSNKIADWTKQMGVTDAQTPGSSDPLGFAEKQMKLTQGVKNDGDYAAAIINVPGAMNGQAAPMVMLIPVTDYDKFLGNFPDAKTDGAVSSINFGMPPQPGFVAKWGDYAAISPIKDLITTGNTAGVIAPSASATKELADKDICVLVNMSAVRALALPLIAAGRAQVSQQFVAGIRQTPFAKYAGVIKAAFNELTDFAQNVLTDCDDVTAGASIASDGITGSMLVNFKPDSHYGQRIAAEKDTDAPLFAGLPQGKYLALGGGVTDPKFNSEMFNDMVAPLQPEIDKLGSDGQLLTDYMQVFKDITAAKTGAAFGMVAPEGELGASPLMQSISVSRGDAKTLEAAVAKLLEMQTRQMKTLMAGGANPTDISFTPAAKTQDGVTFDQYHVGVNMAVFGQNPQMAKIGQIMTFAYGQDGMNIYTGVVNDTTVLAAAGLPDDKISAAIAAAKSNEDVLSKEPGISSTASHLPKMRQAAFFLPIDTVVNTVFTYIAKFGLDMGVTMPASDPIGVTIGSDGSSARIDAYVPNQLVVGASGVARKLIGGPHAAGPGGGL